MFLSTVFYAKVVDDKRKLYWATDVFEESWGVGEFEIAICGESFFEQLVC